MSSKEVYILIPRTCEYVRFHNKGELKLQMELGLPISSIQEREVPLYYLLLLLLLSCFSRV